MNQQELSSFIWSVADLLRWGKLLESETLVQQAANNTKEQFSNSPDLSSELRNAIMDALAAHNTMSTQALESDRISAGLKDILLGPAQLYEALRERADSEGSGSKRVRS